MDKLWNVKVKLYDAMGFLTLVADVHETPPVIVWGERVFLRGEARRYEEAKYIVLTDTAQQLQIPDSGVKEDS